MKHYKIADQSFMNYSGYSGRGRPRQHGQRMKLNDPDTWMAVDETIESDHHPQQGQVRIRQWQDLHFYRAAKHPVNLILVESSGKSPGWVKGNIRTKPSLYPTVKKRVSRSKKSPKVAA